MDIPEADGGHLGQLRHHGAEAVLDVEFGVIQHFEVAQIPGGGKGVYAPFGHHAGTIGIQNVDDVVLHGDVYLAAQDAVVCVTLLDDLREQGIAEGLEGLFQERVVRGPGHDQCIGDQAALIQQVEEIQDLLFGDLAVASDFRGASEEGFAVSDNLIDFRETDGILFLFQVFRGVFLDDLVEGEVIGQELVFVYHEERGDEHGERDGVAFPFDILRFAAATDGHDGGCARERLDIFHVDQGVVESVALDVAIADRNVPEHQEFPHDSTLS